jgi:hypothetical protein
VITQFTNSKICMWIGYRVSVLDVGTKYVVSEGITEFILQTFYWSIKVKVKLSLYLTNWALCHEGIWGSGCIYPHFLDLGTSWRWVVSFTPWPLYTRGKSPQYSLDRRLGGPQSRSGRREEVKILIPNRTWTPTQQSSSPQPVAIPTVLYRLLSIDPYVK